jgi:iron complex transport system substrate-binding protein
MMQLAGATNAADFKGYKPLTSEALLSIAPEVVITMRRHGASNNQTLLNSLPGYKESPAGKNGRLIEMDAHYLLGFGPRTHEAALDLMSKLYPELAQ